MDCGIRFFELSNVKIYVARYFKPSLIPLFTGFKWIVKWDFTTLVCSWIDSPEALFSPMKIFSIFAAILLKYSRILIHFSRTISQKVLIFRAPYPRKCSLSVHHTLESAHFPCTIPWKVLTFRSIDADRAHFPCIVPSIDRLLFKLTVVWDFFEVIFSSNSPSWSC